MASGFRTSATRHTATCPVARSSVSPSPWRLSAGRGSPSSTSCPPGSIPQARRETWQLIESIRDHGVTILLVTHLMEEAERLADRVAVFDHGRVIAIDSPTGIVSMVDPEQRLRFRPSAPVQEDLLTDLSEVRRVERSGPFVVVTGTGNLIGAVASVLARHQIVANDLRIEQANLDDAYLALTGRLAAPTAKELS